MTSIHKIQLEEAILDIQRNLKKPCDVTNRLQFASESLRKQEIRLLLSALDGEIDDLQRSIQKIEESRVEWAKDIRKLKAELRVEEEKEMEEFCIAKDSSKVRSDAFDHILKVERAKLALQLELAELEDRVPTASTIQSSSPSPITVQLPAIHLESFNGNRNCWTEFYENFIAAVHNANMGNVQKMTYLRTLLAGEAKSVIRGLPLTNESYEVALDLLKEKYEDKVDRSQQLYRDLVNLDVCSTFEDCVEFASKVECLCRQLQALGRDTESEFIYANLETKLSKVTFKEILNRKANRQDWNTSKFRSTLKEIIQKEQEFRRMLNQRTDGSRSTPSQKTKERNNSPRIESSITFVAPTNEKVERRQFAQCPPTSFFKQQCNLTGSSPQTRQPGVPSANCRLCSKLHWTDNCTTYKTVTARKERAKELKLCFKCLSKVHMANTCDYKVPCWHCKQQHNRAFCPQKFSEIVETTVSTTATVPTEGGRVLLMTANAVLCNPKRPNKRQKVVVFFDTGAHRSYVSREIAEKLQLVVERESSSSICTFGAEAPISVRRQTTTAQILQRNGEKLPIQLDLADSIISTDVPIAIISDWPDYKLDDIGSFVDVATCDRRPDVLIGMDQQHLFRIVTEKQLKNGYHLSSSILGPIVSGLGSIPKTATENEPTVSSLAVDTQIKPDELFSLVQQHYDLEKSCLEETEVEETEERIVEQFNTSLKIVEGRYEVSLPWKKPMPPLNNNYWLARGRLRSTMKMLQQKPALLDQYNQIMTEQLDKGVIEIVPPEEVNKGEVIHYLPHQAVVREDKLHTKLRIVYDGSAKTGKGSASINQCLHRGPVLLSDLVGILLRFRLPKICIVADIEKAFLQLSVSQSDRDACRFLWPTNPHEEEWEMRLSTYRFCRVTFGLICSPFLLAATIKEHLRREGSTLSHNILENIYVDNVIMHASSENDVLKLCNKAREIFSSASMNLREFASNDRASILQIPEDNRMPKPEVKVLGLRWDTEKDVLRIIPTADVDSVWTKRRVLTLIASVFDPLGLLTPAMLDAKLYFQNLWKEKLSWDDPLPDELSKKFSGIVASWNTEITVPRRIFESEDERYELHVFSDASGCAFGAAAYLRVLNGNAPQSQLIYSKSRVKSLSCSTRFRDWNCRL